LPLDFKAAPEVVRNNLIIKKCEMAQRANLLMQNPNKRDDSKLNEVMKKKETSQALVPID
jgi:hypothetical protein